MSEEIFGDKKKIVTFNVNIEMELPAEYKVTGKEWLNSVQACPHLDTESSVPYEIKGYETIDVIDQSGDDDA